MKSRSTKRGCPPASADSERKVARLSRTERLVSNAEKAGTDPELVQLVIDGLERCELPEASSPKP